MFVPTIKGSKPESVSKLSDDIVSLKIDAASLEPTKMSDTKNVQEKDDSSNAQVTSQARAADSPSTVSTPSTVSKPSTVSSTPATVPSTPSDNEITTPDTSETTEVETLKDKGSVATEPIPIVEEEEAEASITVAEHDKDRIIVTLPNGTRYEADRYCPHAGADMYTHGQISLDEYGPEIGPIILCPMHYWEFLLDKEGNSTNGWATLDACQDLPSGTPPSNFDIPTTIVLYVCVILVGVGMCFCLQRANRLLPNGLNFALQPTALRRGRSRGNAASFPDDDIEAQQGLLNDDDDISDVEDETYRRRQAAIQRDDQEYEADEFGELQEAPNPDSNVKGTAEELDESPEATGTRARIFSIQDDEGSDGEAENRAK
ncbi:hypothetical protein INT43_002019 [Umbelopsis isabellina]|uniref:Rieske domain-containing protein n=1 Tax=Mortierella isabellina TaxID=91625 RepID=A0A8H7UHB9_MORIS|nr:hypothetical protein INT43_002019 [Umbelopsis isabellina]